MQTTPPCPCDVGPAGHLLSLLRDGADRGAYERLLDEYPAQDRPRLAALVDDALHVREQLAERSRREAELGALYETAGDLSSLRDLEAVLQAIVRRAHGLLGTDVAYLMLNDPQRGDTYMRVTDGIRTKAFKQTRLAMGGGLGGLVAKTAVPYSTADYFEDSRFDHSAEVDANVRGEGLISIQGVPLKLGDNVIGVLFAANRRVRPFSEHEVALLVSLADHAAIAIENATLFQDVRRAVDELTEANALIRAHSESIERAAALHERLTTIVLDGGTMADVAQTLADVLGGSILVLDPRGRTMAAAGDDPLVEQARAEGALPDRCPASTAVRDARMLGTGSRRTRRIPAGADGSAACATPIVAGTEVLGVLLLTHDHLDASRVHSLERAALVTALMLLSERTVAEAEHRLRGEILEDILGSPHRDPEGLIRRATLVGLDLHRPHTVLATRCRDSAQRRRIADTAAAYATHAKGLAGVYRGDTVVLLPQDPDPNTAAGNLAAHLSRTVDTPVTVGAAAAGPGAEAIIEAHRDATRCLDVLLALDRDGEGACPDALGIYGLLFHQTGREELYRFVHRTIGPVLDYDTRRGGELTRTLRAYFACDQSLNRTAVELYIHINTLYQRMTRITSLLGPDWRGSEQTLHIHLALKIHTVLSAG